jgi:hypothetical protein
MRSTGIILWRLAGVFFIVTGIVATVTDGVWLPDLQPSFQPAILTAPTAPVAAPPLIRT